MCVLGALYLGNPKDVSKRVEVTTDVSKIRQAENASKTAESLAVNLLLAMFSEEELKKGNCTTPRREDIFLLDQNRVSAIGGMTLYIGMKIMHT